MNSVPTVSVVVAAYNADRYLEFALRDVLQQTWTDMEIIVSDDADSPTTRKLVEGLNDTRLRYRANPARLGAVGNHRAALSLARGRFVAILNHDDRWHPAFLATLIGPLVADPQVRVAFCDHRVIDEQDCDLIARAEMLSARYGRNRLSPGRQRCIAGLFVSQTMATDIAAVFRRDAVNPDDLPEHAGPAYDLWLGYLLARTGGAAYFVPERLTAWREHRENLTSQGGLAWCTGALTCWRQAASDPALVDCRSAINAKLVTTLNTRAGILLRSCDTAAARSDALESLRLSRRNPRAAALLALSFVPSFLRRPCLNARSG